MKTLPQLSNTKSLARHDPRQRGRRFLQTDCSFQTHADDVAVAPIAPQVRPQPTRADLRAFRHLSDDYLNRESRHEYLIEALVYGLVAAIAAWPLVSMLMLLAETARG